VGAIVTIHRLLYELAVFFNRLIAFLLTSRKLHNARFARLDEQDSLSSPLQDTDTSLLLGVNHFHQVLSVRPTKTRSELGNLLIVAPTRGGKGLLAISQLLSWKHSVIVNDIKGELYLHTAGYRSTLGPVFVIDPTGVGHRYDPLLGKQTEDALLSSATHLLFKPDEGEGAIFTQRAIVMLTQMLLASRIEGIAPLPYLRFLIRLGLADTATRLNTISPELATQFLDDNFFKADLTSKFLLSSWGTLTARMRPLLTETVVRSLTHSDFTAGELMHPAKPISVYMRWKEQDLLALSPLVRLLWGSLIDSLTTTYDAAAGKRCQPVLLLIDEAGRTAIPSLADHATTVVGRGISLWIAIQSLSQLETVYGKPRATVLRDNMDSQLFYRPSNQQTADYLEHCLGKKSNYAHSEFMREGVKESLGLSEQGVPLMPSQEIKQLGDEDIIGFHRHLPPLRLKRMDWRRFPILTQRQRIPAPRLSALPQLEDSLQENAWQRPEQLTSPYIDPDFIQ
jgi:type IV secretion system protein VirD4